ncbi:PAS domain-containing protein [Paracoccus sp. MC1854]|uniref:PAS domain-containing sensor histidine kinase n=1 Tax=Paracoccus sp. MC1854 TaxID=2760306 RepID=UPI0015FF9081|nr:PAS domain-containing protein [Paracoccus sp. MC1854]MBB1492310.1 PAS domain-containing protein [Paracoccus sp. MC1854]
MKQDNSIQNSGFLSGGGELGERIRLHDWAGTPPGPIEGWPQALRLALSICLHSSFPTAIYWGPDFRLLYNDAWSPVPGERHPAALGRPAAEVWSDIWDVVGPQLARVMETGEGFSTFDQMLPMVRHGVRRETYWNYSFTPIREEDGAVVGVFNQGHETTAAIMAHRDAHAEIDRLGRLFAQAPTVAGILRGPDHVIEVVNPAFKEMVGRTDIEGMTVAEALPELVPQGFLTLLDRVLATGEPHVGRAVPITFRGLSGEGPQERVVDFVYQPLGDPGGLVQGVFVQVTDVTHAVRAEAALRESEARYAAIVNSIDQMIWSALPDGSHDYFNHRWYDFTGAAPGTTDGAGWKEMFHPEDQERAQAAWMHCVATGEPYHIVYRLRHRSGRYRWVVGRALCIRDAEGRITRWFGTCTDIHDLKEAEAKRRLLLREMDHRVKNLFAVALGMVSMTARGAASVPAMAEALRGRLGALAKAHDLIRSAVGGETGKGQITPLHELIEKIARPHLGADGGDRISFDGPEVILGESASVGMALIFHELATNAAKYGALATAEGRITVTWSASAEELALVWKEEVGGAGITPPDTQGFGSQLAHATATDQFGGAISFDWQPGGLVIDLRARLDHLQQ